MSRCYGARCGSDRLKGRHGLRPDPDPHAHHGRLVMGYDVTGDMSPTASTACTATSCDWPGDKETTIDEWVVDPRLVHAAGKADPVFARLTKTL